MQYLKLKDKVKPSVPPLEAGPYMAVCTAVIDIGQQYSEKSKAVQNKLLFLFDVPSETIEIDGVHKPRQFSRRVTYTTSTRGVLNPMLCSWLSTRFTEEQLREYELFDLVGKGCQIQLSISEDGKYNNIENVIALPKGVPTPVSSNPHFAYDIDAHGFSGAEWDALPEWVRSIIEKSEQYQLEPPDQALDMPNDEAPQTDTLDDETGCPI